MNRDIIMSSIVYGMCVCLWMGEDGWGDLDVMVCVVFGSQGVGVWVCSGVGLLDIRVLVCVCVLRCWCVRECGSWVKRDISISCLYLV